MTSLVNTIPNALGTDSFRLQLLMRLVMHFGYTWEGLYAGNHARQLRI